MNDDEAFAEAYRAHYRAISRYVARRLDARAHEVDELVAEVFSTAWRRRADLPEHPLPWLYGVARHCVANEVRGRGRRRRLLRKLGETELTSGPVPDAEPAGAWVRDALSTLSPADQEVLRLVAWEGLTVDEVAVAVGCGRSAAAMRLQRARQRLRERIEAMDMTVTARGDRER